MIPRHKACSRRSSPTQDALPTGRPGRRARPTATPFGVCRLGAPGKAKYNMPQIHLTITGRVQGVGFRAYVMTIAERLGLDGQVWNTRAGNVEAVAQHEDEKKLEAFAAAMRAGPGYVKDVQKNRTEIPHLGPGFSVGPTV